MARVALVTSFVGAYSLTVQDCYICGVVFALTPQFMSERRASGASFSCPNGHSMFYPKGERQDEREKRVLRLELDAARREVERQRGARKWAESRAHGANIVAGKAKAAHRRLEHRIACGVCPKCNRTFRQLAAHMKSKHS